MQTQDTTSTATSWSSATNWAVAGGSLVNSVNLESSFSPIDDGDGEDRNSNPKSTLILHPNSPDLGACEITISFTQKHEVQQVYVRSTARVYEIYYAPDLQSGNEYLCTVRCGKATKDEEMLHSTDSGEVVSKCLKDCKEHLAEATSRSDSNSSTNEDDWVEVKVPDNTLLDNRNITLQSKSDTNLGKSAQDFYEATAEITDANPCISLTLRMLSLQSKHCVYVDDVYVFADPVDSADLEIQGALVEKSAGSSLMAMLVPTLLQLSKTAGTSQIQDKQTFDTGGKQIVPEIRSKATDLSCIATTIQQEGKSHIAVHENVQLQELNTTTDGPPLVQIPSQVSDTESKSNFAYSRIERAMDQLVSRVSRIEDLCLRFEENMLKPVSSIEARLLRVEQQLEVLVKKSQNSGLLSCTRISAPEFSDCKSDSSSYENDSLHSEALESDKKSIPSDNMAELTNTGQLIPSLVITAPEFSDGEDEEENQTSESMGDSQEDAPKHVVSIDDALASALAGLLSSTSVQPQKYTETLTVKAPDFANEEDGNDSEKSSPSVESETATEPSICETNVVECKDPGSTSCNTSLLESEGNVRKPLYEDLFEKMSERVDEQCHARLEREKGDSEGPVIDNTVTSANHGVAGTDSYHSVEDTENENFGNGISEASVLDKDGIPNLVSDQAEDGSDTTPEEAIARTDSTAVSEVTEVSEKGTLQNVLEFSNAASVVDFEIPILDVKFTSQKTETKSALEALLADVPELNVEAPCVMEIDESSLNGEKGDLILPEDLQSTVPAIDSHYLVDFDYFEMPSNMEGEDLQEKYACCNSEMAATSLI